MNGEDKVNRELARLDTELRAGGIDRATFRAQRRRLLLDFEERATTTQPAAVTAPRSEPAARTEITLVDDPGDITAFVRPTPPAAQPAAPERRDPEPAAKKSVAGIAIYVAGAIAVLSLAGWWFTRPNSDAPATLPSVPTSAGASTPSAITGAQTPQSIAATLTESQWTDTDVANFLAHWNQLSPEAIQSATEDSRIWLLRGETGRRLREARETESLEQSSENRERVEQLELVQRAVGTP